jgi:hypothetical protein
MQVKPDDGQLKGLAEFYDKYTQEKIEELKPFFNDFVSKSDFASLTAFCICLDDVKRALFVRDTLKVHTEPVDLDEIKNLKELI